MKSIVWLIVAFGVFYAHGQYTFTEKNIQKWLNQHEDSVMAGQDKACDDYTYDLKAHIRAGHATGQWQVDGGREMMCEYEKHASAPLMLANATITTEREITSIERSSFPWMTATVKVREDRKANIGRLRALKETAETTYVFERKIRTISASKVDSESEGNFLR